MRVERWASHTSPDPAALDRLDDVDLLVVDGDAGPWALWAACPVLAQGGPADLVLDDDDLALVADDIDGAVAALAARAAAWRAATRALAHVLRVTRTLDVPDALVVESMAYSMLLAGPDFARWLAERPPPSDRADDGSPLTVVRDGDVLRIRLARPAVRNAYSAAMRDALVEALALAEVDHTIAAVDLAGDGPAFCSGGDLREFGTAPDVVRAHQVRTLRSVAAALHRVRERVTVTVHGPCVGAGVELPAFAARVHARPAATFRLPELVMGLVPGAGGTVGVARRIGRSRTMLLALLDAPIDVDTARRWGLVDKVVDDE